jgi:hypothetical protein
MKYHPPHRDKVTALYGRPNLRSRLHFGHSREGDHKVRKRRVVALAKKEKIKEKHL